ncbi:MAG: PilZ domain-containing protein [Acidobacteriota bacterium]|nr:PilZ domain-containing protein [Acidobacteriota bacterium]MDH3784659.1 PilZ domain-containing protein [Acidobacteriota bacterium]
MSEDPAERRAHPRIAKEIVAECAPQSGGVVARMMTRNLSLGGLFCTSAAHFPEMTQVAIRLMLPVKQSGNGETEALEVDAVVVRSEPLPDSPTSGEPRYELGLFFTNLSDTGREQLQRYLS